MEIATKAFAAAQQSVLRFCFYQPTKNSTRRLKPLHQRENLKLMPEKASARAKELVPNDNRDRSEFFQALGSPIQKRGRRPATCSKDRANEPARPRRIPHSQMATLGFRRPGFSGPPKRPDSGSVRRPTIAMEIIRTATPVQPE